MKNKAATILNILSGLLLIIAMYLFFFETDAYYIAGIQVVNLILSAIALAFITAVAGLFINRSRVFSWVILGVIVLIILAIVLFFANFEFKM